MSCPRDPLARARIAAALGYADVAAMEARHWPVQRACVEAHFAALFSDGAARPAVALDLAPLWEPALDRAPLLEQLARLSDDGAALLARLESLVQAAAACGAWTTSAGGA